MSEQTVFECWAIVELMGHRRLAGYVREQEIAGVGLLRLDVPGKDGEPAATQFYHPNALYCLTPTTEEIARAVAARNRPEPVHYFELPAPPYRCPECGRTTEAQGLCERCADRPEEMLEEADDDDPARVF